MSIWQKIGAKIKQWLGGGSRKKKTPPQPRAVSYNRDARNQTVSSRTGTGSTFNKRELVNSLKAQEKEEKRVQDAFKARSATTHDMTSSFKKPSQSPYERQAESSKKAKEDIAAAFKKESAPDPKVKAAKESRERLQKRLDKIKEERESFNEATGHKYDTEVGTKEERARARQRIKAGEYQSDAKAEMWEVKHHPIASSAARGALSGTTFGASELIAQKSKKRKESGAEEYYQKHKNKTAETVGEIAGSLASFGMTAGATEKLGAKAIGKVAPKAAERLAEKEIIKSAAKRSVNKAVKKGLVSEASEELIKQVGKDKAAKIVSALGTDAIQNLTTGAIYDINRASTEHEVGSADWWRELGKSAALNFGITGAVAGASALSGGKRLATEAATKLDMRRGLRELADSRAGASRIQAPRIGESIEDRIARVNAERLGANADDAVGRTARNADDVARNATDAEKAISDIDAEIEKAHRVASDVNATAEERQAAVDRFDELIKERKGAVDVAEEAFDEQAYRESLDDVIPFTSDTPTTPKRGLPKGYKSKEENVQGLLERDDVPFATVDESMPSTNPELTAENELRDGLERRVEKIGEQGEATADDAIKVNDVASDTPVSESLPSGVKQIRSAYEYNNGEKIEDGIKTRWNEAWNASKEYSESHAKGERERMSKVAVSQLNAMDSEAERKLRQQLVDSGDLNYEAISTPEMYDKIAKQMRDDADRWVKDMIDINEGGALDFRSTPEWQARVQYILGTVDPSADEASEIAYTEAFKLAQNISSKGGQVLNLRRNFVHLTELGKRDAILDDFINILEKSAGFSKNHPAMNNLYKFDRRNYIRKYLMDDEGIRDGINKVVNAESLDDVSEAFTELMIKVNQKNPKSGFDVLQELRYLNMLGNPKTHIRNVFGSGFFAPMRQASNAIRAGIEDRIVASASKKAGVKMEITKHGGLSLEAAKEAWVKNPTTEAGKSALEAFERMKSEILGAAKYETPTYTGRGKTIAGKTLDSLSDFNSMLLSKEDDFFRSRAFRENYIKSYNRYLKDGKPITNKVKKMIEQEALKESQIATFNEYNDFARMLNRVQSKANDVNATGWQRWGSRAVNAAMPFTKVPANLMKQSVNYSPLGIARGMAGIKTAAKKGDSVLLNKAIDELSSGLTGSAVFGLGMLLGKTTHNMFGVEVNATTNTGKNDPAAKFKKDRGMQNYSITFKDPETGQGHSFTLDWLVPTSATFFSGVEFADQLKKGELGLSAFGDWSTVVSRLAEPVMETSMLSGLHGMLETMRSGSRSDDDKGALDILIRELGQSYLNSIIPTVAGQAARTAYKTDMQITGDTDWEYWRNQMKSKAGLANTGVFGEALGADTDTYGNIKGEKNSAEDYIKSGLKNFLSPANIQKVDFSEIDKEKLRTYEEAVKSGKDPQDMAYLFPKKQYKKQFSVGGEDVKMTNRELSTYNQAKTTGGQEGMRYILENYMFNRQEYDENGKKVPSADAYTKEQKAELISQFEGKSMREVEEWLYSQPEFKNATDAERKRAIKGLWDLSKDSKTVASQRVGEQAVWAAQGKDVNEYNYKNEITEKRRDALQPYVDAGIISYEEAVDFARNAGKTYYTETDDGGTSATYYNKKEMIEYLVEKGYSYEKAEALFNAFKNARAKPYSGNDLSSGRRGYYRRGWRHYGHGGGGGSKKAPAIKQSDFKASKATYKDLASSLKTAPRSRGLSTASPVKIEPPKVKFKKYEV